MITELEVELPGLRFGLLANDHFDRSAFLVQAVELGRNFSRLLGVGGSEEANAEVRLADAPAGVDARPQRKAEVAAARRLHQPRGFGKRRKADVLPPRHDPQALRHERPVEALQARDVRHGAERDQVEKVEDLRLGQRLEQAAPAQLADQRYPQQEGHADRGKMAVRRPVIAFVEAVGVDQRMRDREQACTLMVVDDDDIEPGRLGFFQRLERLRSAVDAHRDAGTAPFQLDQRFAGRAVAFHQPVGDIDDWRRSEPPEEEHEQRRAGRAVDVIVAEDRDRLALLHRVGEPLGALVHVLEAARVGQEVADPRVAVTSEIVAGDAAGEQQLVDQRVHAGAIIRLPPPAPRLASYRSLHLQSCAHASELSSSLRNSRAAPLGIAGIMWVPACPPATPN